ncbi:MAG: polysaccharide biosynthesis C-terminal domain-containing protein [Eubacterium sp.]|nr:polysaccharide biosynthesis C-terminal domain-containing protein [Eubacterium sp.]
MNYKSEYLSGAFLLLLTSVIVKVIGAVYKIPLTAFIGAVGRGYYASAYNIYIPIHTVIMGAFPIALSRICAKYRALGNQSALFSLRKSAEKIFLAVGFIASVLMVALFVPYCLVSKASEKCFYSVLFLAPSLLFSSLASVYRGWYEGCMNMRPTAVSQTIEALFKLVFGLLFARYSMAFLYNSYLESGYVLKTFAANEEEALSLIYPITSAAAVFGVTFGCFASFVYVFVYNKIKSPANPIKYSKNNKYSGELLGFSFPIMISCAVQSLFQFLDTASVQAALSLISESDLKNAYRESLALSKTAPGDTVTYVWGILSAALDFKNLVPGITMALGVCAVPAVSAAFESKNKEHLAMLINSVYKYTSIISFAGGIIIALNAKDILSLFYSKSAPDIVAACEEPVKYFALSVFIYSLAGAAVFCVQAVGKPKKSVFPFIVSGIIRVILNILLISNEKYILLGSVISGAAGYLIILIWNSEVLKKWAQIEISLLNSLIKPALIALITYFLLKKSLNYFDILSSGLIKLLMKVGFSGLVYCILCFLFKLLSFEEIFCILKTKKNGLNT